MKLMKHNHKKIIILSGICLFFCLFCPAQNITNLPTSMYGIGELNNGEGGRYAGICLGLLGMGLWIANIVDAYKGGKKKA